VGAERAGSRRAALRPHVREALRGDPGLRDVEFVHVEEAVRALERGGTGRFFMKEGVALTIERGRIINICE
jgi:hypothetical protein